MERRLSSSSISRQQTSTEEHLPVFTSGARVELQGSASVDNEASFHETFAAFEVAVNTAELAGEEKSESKTSPLAEQEETLTEDNNESQDKGKAPETQMSYPGDYYHYSRMASGQSERDRTTSTTNRRPDTSRSSTTSGSSSSSSSSASTPRQGSEAARDKKKDDKSGSGGGSGSASTSGGGSSGGSGSSRSRLVAGVFVRY